jgi:histidinol-phosphate phosphatase family protein
MNKAIFLDRDGTIIEDTGYAHKIEDLILFPEAVEGLKLLKDEYKFFIISNQSGIEKGLFTVEDFLHFNNHLLTLIARDGIVIERTCFCPHEGGCDCRKPSTKFVDEISREYSIDLAKSWVIGGHPSDVAMGIKAGCMTVYLLTSHGEKHLHELDAKGIEPTLIASDFYQAAVSINEYRSKEF